ncbi:ABC transporter permease [Tsukamurella spumae]|uniref:ABC transporter permease n=1 Tax=Tsukamurella spumae TaxID=44753 RepID=A0A846X0S2_9ACTN|nr:ABC transporter permease [Tsukamurella spumae]NKY19147.1 ABC transporter permease [Tsukamurella spumae]
MSAPASVRPGGGGAARLASAVQSYGAAIVLLVVVVVGTFAFASFASVGNFQNIAIQSSFLLIIAVGMTFVIMTGGIDLSVGSVFALGGVLAAYGSRWGVAGALLLPVIVCAGIGLFQGFLIAYGRMPAFIVTLAGLLGARGIVLAITDGGGKTPIITDRLTIALGQETVLGFRLATAVAVLILVLGAIAVTRTGAGQSVLAVGGSESAAALMGVPVARVQAGVYLLSGTCAGLAGALSAWYSSSGVPTVGVGMELTVISAVVIGGTLLAGGAGNMIGTLAGVLLLGVIQNLINQIGSLTTSVQLVVSGGFLAVVVVLQTILARRSAAR